jgi:hypothetical protein
MSLLASACRGVPETRARGTLGDVERHLERLLKASDPHAFLVIEVQGTPHFLQFTASAAAIEMDYPLATQEQQAREAAVGTFCREAGLQFRKTEGSDGTRFLDCDLPHDAASAATLVRRALEDLFGASSTSQLLFSGDGLPRVAA